MPARPPDLFELLNAAWMGQAVYAAVGSGAIDALAAGPRRVDELAIALGVHPMRLKQIFRALASWRVLETDDHQSYRLSDAAEPLVQDRESWLRHYVLLWGEQLFPAADYALEMLRDGPTAFALAHGHPLYEHYQRTPSANRRFVDFMDAVTLWQRQEIVRCFDFSAFRTIVDIGGGKAGLLTEILKGCPDAQGEMIDQPHMRAAIEAQIRAHGLQSRCRFVACDFFEPLPVRGELFLIKHVLHDWDDHDASRILRRIRDAMQSDSRLLIVEGLLDESRDNACLLASRDLEQLFWTGGRLRSRQEFADLLASCGLRLGEVRPTAVKDADLLICQAAEVKTPYPSAADSNAARPGRAEGLGTLRRLFP